MVSILDPYRHTEVVKIFEFWHFLKSETIYLFSGVECTVF